MNLKQITDFLFKPIIIEKTIIHTESKTKGSGGQLGGQIDHQAISIAAQDIKKYKDAVALASDPQNADFSALSQLYDNLLLDGHLASTIESRILFAQRHPFKFVGEGDSENKEITWLFERPWFDELIYKVLMSKWRGRTLIEFTEIDSLTGEVKEINEIPQGNFNPEKGIILKSIGDQNGWDYRGGINGVYYLQIGKNRDLGQLANIAPIVLAKKLSLGAFLDYIESYGVPSLSIITDREDQERLNQLADAARNFRKNNWLVGRGNEKVEIHQAADGSAPFNAMFTLANDEISKRVLGGSGLTDEKAFVGSAEIQYRLAKDRFESDKLFFKYVFNAEIKPRLIKMSPVYASLANYYFDWDNSETMNQKEQLEYILKFSEKYEIDPEFVAQTTGYPITGIKSSFGMPAAVGGQPNGLGK